MQPSNSTFSCPPLHVDSCRWPRSLPHTTDCTHCDHLLVGNDGGPVVGCSPEAQCGEIDPHLSRAEIRGFHGRTSWMKCFPYHLIVSNCLVAGFHPASSNLPGFKKPMESPWCVWSKEVFWKYFSVAVHRVGKQVRVQKLRRGIFKIPFWSIRLDFWSVCATCIIWPQIVGDVSKDCPRSCFIVYINWYLSMLSSRVWPYILVV
jgi:hypothetical protein